MLIFLYLLRLNVWPNIWSILENVPHALRKNAYTVVVDRLLGIFICLIDLVG